MNIYITHTRAYDAVGEAAFCRSRPPFFWTDVRFVELLFNGGGGRRTATLSPGEFKDLGLVAFLAAWRNNEKIRPSVWDFG